MVVEVFGLLKLKGGMQKLSPYVEHPVGLGGMHTDGKGDNAAVKSQQALHHCCPLGERGLTI